MNTDELARKGEDLYKAKFKADLEKTDSGRYAAIDVHSGECFVADSPEEATRLGAQKHPDGFFHLVRIGHEGVYRLGSFFSSHGDYAVLQG
ncbi:MAG: hypothetical protein HY304_03915 [candidate division Zixibacteria bacterium]|nr:hypothetical protein [candidate division Zixibacteria bacterium]